MPKYRNLLREKTPIDKSFIPVCLDPDVKGKIIVDFEIDELLKLEYEDFVRSKGLQYDNPNLLGAAICEHFRTSIKEDEAKNIVEEPGDHLVGDLLLKYKGGVCRHLNLACAAIMERIIKTAKIDTRIFFRSGAMLQSSDYSVIPHAWIELWDGRVLLIIDPVRGTVVPDLRRMNSEAWQKTKESIVRTWQQLSEPYLPYNTMVKHFADNEGIDVLIERFEKAKKMS